MEKHYTYKQAAERFQVSVQTIRRWSKKGILKEIVIPSGKFGRPRILATSIEALEQQGKLTT